jgi:glycolate oxidase FAD binding subunit
MSVGAAEGIVPRLQALLGAAAVVTAETDRWAVEGIAPVAVIRPADGEQIAATLRLCAEAGVTVVPWGGGTAMHVGNQPRAVGIVLCSDGLGTVVEHDHSNLTATVQAGMSLGSLGAALAAHRQFLPLEPPRAEAATVGGTVAVNLNGPRRMRYGSVRDLVIGLRVALADGTVVRFGGKTVKNVAGYEMGRLFVGSLGTLGIVTEVTFKVWPLPEVSRTAIVWASDPAGLLTVAARLFDSPLIPSAVTLVAGQVARRFGQHAWGLLVRAEGVEPAVVRHERDISGWATAAGLDVEVCAGDHDSRLWQAVRDFGWTDEAAAIRLSLPPGKTAALLEALLGEGGSAPTGTSGLVVDLGTGTIWIGFDDVRMASQALPSLRGLVAREGGNLLAARVPPEAKALADVWSPTPPPRVLEIMRRLKQSFDPHHILNPGRFVAGL